MIMFVLGKIKLLLKLISPVSFYFNVAMRKLQITYVPYVIYPLDSAAPEKVIVYN